MEHDKFGPTGSGLLFHRTIMENIRYMANDVSDEEVYEAARQARCHGA